MRPLCSAAALLALFATDAAAQSAGEFTLGIGVAVVDPKDDNGDLTDNDLEADVEANTRPIATAEYFVFDNVGIELLVAWPFHHDIELEGLGKVGSTMQLPPTLSVQYHFNGQAGQGSFSPFLGVGINYTLFYDTDTSGALRGSDLDLDNSFGFAAHAGLDYRVTDRDSIRADIRYIDIDSDAKLDGEDIGTVEVDPFIYGVSYVRRF